MSNQQLRMEAHARGEKTYSTGKACKHGHVAKRYVVNGGCVECTNGLRMPSRIAADLQPWQPLFLQVPTGLDIAQLDELNDYLFACALTWMDVRKMLTTSRAEALSKLLNARVNQRKLRDASGAVVVPVAPAAAPPPKAADVPQREPLTRERFGR
jgi:hypothetical protein